MSPPSLAGRRALVTGASGFLGTWLRRRLAAVGAEVHAVSRAERAAERAGERWWRADLAEPGAAGKLLGEVRPDVVFHLASHVTGVRDLSAIAPTFAANLAAAVHLLVAASEVGVGRIVLAGSLEEPEGDASTAVPASPYAAAKWAAGAYARMCHALYSTPAVIARIFMVYGPGPQDEAKLVPYVIGRLLAGESPELGPGTRAVDWIYVEDVVCGLEALAVAPGIEGETVDLGTGRLATVREVAERIAERIGGAAPPLRFGSRPERPLERVRAADPAPARERAGFIARVELDEGLDRTIAWFRDRRARAAR